MNMLKYCARHNAIKNIITSKKSKIFYNPPMLLSLRRVMLFIIILSNIMLVSCQSTVHSNINGLISEISYGDNKIYLFGSMHIGKQSYYPLHEVVDKAIKLSDVFVFEYDFNIMVNNAGFTTLVEDMTTLENQTLEEYLTAGTFEYLIEMLEYYNRDYEDVKNYKPMYLLNNILLSEAIGYSDYTTTDGVDLWIYNYAARTNKRVIGLNGAQNDFELAFDAPYEVQVSAIESIVTRDEMLDRLNTLAFAYENNNEEALASMFNSDKDMSKYGKYSYDTLVIYRNQIFADKIEQLLKETDEPTIFFITVGAGHLIGEDSIFKMLEKKGFEITRMIQ